LVPFGHLWHDSRLTREEPGALREATAHMPALAEAPLVFERKARRPMLAMLLRGCVAGVVVTVALEAGNVLLGRNFHAVIPGAVYRCSQPSPDALISFIERQHIRTVVNLRGCCDPMPWYLEQCRITSNHDVSEEDISFSSGRLPPVPALRQLVRVIECSEKPILFHCHKGIDRTGMASTLALLLCTDATAAEARRQLDWRHGHLPFGRTGNIDRFFDLYEEWLAKNHLTHSRKIIRHWIDHDYCAGECSAAISLLGSSYNSFSAPRDKPFGIRVRCANTSVKPWYFRPGNNAGVHAGWILFKKDDTYVCDGRSGLFHAVVEPGQHIDLTLSLPALREKGSYYLRVDMVDEQHASFVQEGSEPLFVDLEVP
ncbi:MAG: tyrosine-protein phosphatase, partial [Candidatus Acidiferrum sp.]